MARTTRYCATCLTTFFEDPERCTNMTCGAARPGGGWGVLLGPGDLLDRHYLVERVLAVGGAGLTYLARESDGENNAVGPPVAIKVLYTARDTGPFLRRLSNEAQILQELSHPHIVHCLGFVHRAGHEPYLVTRFEEGGSLQQHVERVGPLPSHVAVAILRQVLLALDVAHQRAVVHRDLKPDNVLLDRRCGADEVPHVRVADFGIAKVHGGLTDRITKLGSFVGTPEYAAPEQFEGLPPTPATDLFAAGGLLWFLLSGKPPVKFSQRHDLGTSYDELLDQVPPRLDAGPTSITDDFERNLLQDVLDHLMATEGEARWTVHQVLHRLLPIGDGQGLSRGVSTLEVTAENAPIRTTGPVATLDTTGGLPGRGKAFVVEGETAVPTAGSSTLDQEPTTPPEAEDTFEDLDEFTTAPADEGPPRPAPSVAGMEAPVAGARVADTVPPPPPHAPPAPPPPVEGATPPPVPRAEARPRLEEPVAATPEPAGSTAWVPRAELVGDGLTPGPSPRQLPDVAVTADLPEPPPQPLGRSPSPPPGPEPLEAETSLAGGAVQAAGCLGLSFVSVTATAGVGLAATLALLLGAAWGFGWFDATSGTTDPLVVRARPPHRWAQAPQLLGSSKRGVVRRRAVQDALSARSGAIGRRCEAKGHAVVELLCEPDGTIVHALIDDGWLEPKVRTCVERELSGFALGVRIPKESRVRVAIPLE